MQYIKIKDGVYVEFDETNNKSRVIVKSEIEKQVSDLEQQVSELPEITDEFLLEWARENYQNSKLAERREQLIVSLSVLKTLLSNLR